MLDYAVAYTRFERVSARRRAILHELGIGTAFEMKARHLFAKRRTPLTPVTCSQLVYAQYKAQIHT